jgi:hypothetical protein
VRRPEEEIATLKRKFTVIVQHMHECESCHKGVWGSGCIDPRLLDLGTSWR